jgi:hypothetical protein
VTRPCGGRHRGDADAVSERGGVVGGQRPGQHYQVGDPRVGDRVVGEPADPAGLDVSAVGQASQVGRDAALGQADVPHAFGHGVLGGQEELQQPQPGRVTQRADLRRSWVRGPEWCGEDDHAV